MNIESIDNNTNESLNPKLCDAPILTESLLKCPLCNQEKTIDKFHHYTREVNNFIFDHGIITYGCKECISLDCFQWNKNKPVPQLNFNKFKIFYINKLKEEYKLKHNIQLYTRSEVQKILNKTKNKIRSLKKLGLLEETKLYLPQGFIIESEKWKKLIFNCFYSSHQIEWLKYIYKNGYLIVRRSKFRTSKYATILQETQYPYYIKGRKKDYLFINETSQMKPCTNCLNIKPFNEFVTNNTTKDKYAYTCKECNKRINADSYKNMLANDKRTLFKQIKEYRRNNKEKIKQSKRQYYIKYPETKVLRSLRKRMREFLKCIKNNIFNSKYNYRKMLDFGCNRKTFKEHIESQFKEGMTWENHGPGFLTNEKGQPIYDKEGNTIPVKQWHLDHILPVSKFDLKDPNSIKHINHYKNLRPEWSNENLQKSNKIIGELINDPKIKEIYDKYILTCYKIKELKNAPSVELINP